MKKVIFSVIALSAFTTVYAQKEHILMVKDIEGKVKEFKASEVQGVIFEDAPEYTLAETLAYTRYEEKNGLGHYTVELGTESDEAGLPLEVGDIMVSLELTAPLSASVEEPELPIGYYMPGTGKAAFTFDVAKSVVYNRVDYGNDGIAPVMILDGTVDVRCTDSTYDIRLELSTFGGPVYMRYVGELPFGRGIAEPGEFNEDINLEFIGAQGRFYGNWYYPFAADLTTDFFVGNIVENVMKSGYVLKLDYCEPKPADCMATVQRIADGTYSVETREIVDKSMYLPFRFNPGKVVDFMGTEYFTGTRLEYFDEYGHRKQAMVTGGTFTVSGNGSAFEFDLEADNGIRITGSYYGTPYIQNFCDNDEKEPQRPYSTVEGDVELKWAPQTYAVSYSDGHNIKEDLNTLFFYVSELNMTTGDYLMFSLLTPEQVVTDGVYEVNNSLEANTIIPGTVGFGGNLMFSWYGDLDSTDEEGYQSILAPIASGTVTVSTMENDERKIVFDLEDDNGNTIRGEYIGFILDVNDYEASAANAKARKMVKGAKRNSINGIRLH